MRARKNPDFARLMGRMYGEGMMPQIAQRHFHSAVTRFFAALERTLPHLTPGELALRSQFMVGAMAHSLIFSSVEIRAMSGASPPKDPATILRELVAFLCGGLRAPGAHKRRRRIGK
jgi:hypothetical protein